MIIIRIIQSRGLVELVVEIIGWKEEEKFIYLVAGIGSVWV